MTAPIWTRVGVLVKGHRGEAAPAAATTATTTVTATTPSATITTTTVPVMLATAGYQSAFGTPTVSWPERGGQRGMVVSV